PTHPVSTPTFTPTKPPTSTPTPTNTPTSSTQMGIALSATCDNAGNSSFTIANAGAPMPSGIRIRWRMYVNGAQVGSGGSVWPPLPQTITHYNTYGRIRLSVYRVSSMPYGYQMMTSLPVQVTTTCNQPTTTTNGVAQVQALAATST